MYRLVLLSALALTGCVVPAAFLFDERVPACRLPALTVSATWNGSDLGAIQGLCWVGPDRVALAGGHVSIREAATGDLVENLSAKWANHYDVARSPDGTLLAASKADGQVFLWDAATGREWGTLVGGTSPLFEVCFSPDGKCLAAGGSGGTAYVWDLATSRCIHEFQVRARPFRCCSVSAIAFSADSTRLVTGDYESWVTVWDARTGQELASFEGHTGIVDTVAFSPSGRVFATGSNDDTVAVWSATDYKELARFKMPNSVKRIAFLQPDDLLVAVGGTPGKIVPASGFIQATRWTTGRVVARRHLWDDYAEALAVAPDGTYCVAATHKGEVLLWRVASR